MGFITGEPIDEMVGSKREVGTLVMARTSWGSRSTVSLWRRTTIVTFGKPSTASCRSLKAVRKIVIQACSHQHSRQRAPVYDRSRQRKPLRDVSSRSVDNSLDNQREASEAYIKSQAHEG